MSVRCCGRERVLACIRLAISTLISNYPLTLHCFVYVPAVTVMSRQELSRLVCKLSKANHHWLQDTAHASCVESLSHSGTSIPLPSKVEATVCWNDASRCSACCQAAGLGVIMYHSTAGLFLQLAVALLPPVYTAFLANAAACNSIADLRTPIHCSWCPLPTALLRKAPLSASNSTAA